MPTLFSGGVNLSRNANLPAWNAFTIVGWARMATTAGSYKTIACLETAGPSPTKYIDLQTFNGVDLLVYTHAGATGAMATLTANTDFFWFLRLNGSTLFAGMALPGAAAFSTTNVVYTDAFTPAILMLGTNGFSEHWNGAIGDVRVYDAALTTQELEAERHFRIPRRTANLNTSVLGLVGNDTTDWLSGNGRNWTLSGTSALTNPFPLAWGNLQPTYIYPPPAAGGSATGTGTPSIPLPTLAGTGIAAHKGTGTPSIPGLTASGTGRDTTMRGTGAMSTPAVVGSGAGATSHPGVGTPSIPAVTGSGSGVASHAGAGTPSIPGLTLAGVGTKSVPVTGAGTPSIGLPTLAGTGKVGHAGTGAMALPALTAAGVGRDGTQVGIGTPSIPRPTLVGIGLASHKGAGTPSIPALVMNGNGYGSGLASPLGVGALSMPALAMVGVGVNTPFSLTALQGNRILRQELQALRAKSEKADKVFSTQLNDLQERVRELERGLRRGLRG